MKRNWSKLENILSKARQEVRLSKADIEFLLGLNKAEQINKLFATAKSLRRKYFGNKIFIYGFIYASTYCRNDCSFCFFRRSNSESQRYRKAKPEIIATARRLADSGVHLIDLTMGEGKRTHASVLKVLEASGLRTATNDEYLSWIKSRRQAIGKHDSRREIAC
jgi:methylornithine synthase